MKLKIIVLAMLLVGVTGGCSKGPSCEELTQQLKIAQIHVMGAEINSHITGSDADYKLALTEQQALMDQFVANDCTNTIGPVGG